MIAIIFSVLREVNQISSAELPFVIPDSTFNFSSCGFLKFFCGFSFPSASLH